MSKVQNLSSLTAKRKFVESLTFKKATKYIDDDNFMTPIKSEKTHEQTINIEETITDNILEADDNISKLNVHLSKKAKSPGLIDHSIITREEDDDTQLTTSEFRRIISLLEMNKQQRKERVPDWAKLALSSIRPNDNVEYY